MHQLPRSAWFIAALLCAPLAAADTTDSSPNISLRIVVTSGMGGQILPRREALALRGRRPVPAMRGGAALLASLVRVIRSDSGPFVLIDTGSLVGDLGNLPSSPKKTAAALNGLGYAAVTLGERDSANPALVEAIATKSHVPLLALTRSPALSRIATNPYVITDSEGYRVAIVGGSLAESGETVEAFADAINVQARLARARGAKAVIAAVHISGTCERLHRIGDIWHPAYHPGDCDQRSPLLLLAHQIVQRKKSDEGRIVDALVGGHGASRGVAAVVDGMPVAAPSADGLTTSEITLKVENVLARNDDPSPPFFVTEPTEICSSLIEETYRCDSAQPPGRKVVRALAPDPQIEQLLRNSD